MKDVDMVIFNYVIYYGQQVKTVFIICVSLLLNYRTRKKKEDERDRRKVFLVEFSVMLI